MAISKPTVYSEAMRLARYAVKDAIEHNRLKISHFTTKQINEAARLLIHLDPYYHLRALYNIERMCW